jgi:hypothetical protein
VRVPEEMGRWQVGDATGLAVPYRPSRHAPAGPAAVHAGAGRGQTRRSRQAEPSRSAPFAPSRAEPFSAVRAKPSRAVQRRSRRIEARQTRRAGRPARLARALPGMIVWVVPARQFEVDQISAEGLVRAPASFSTARAPRSCAPRFVVFLC